MEIGRSSKESDSLKRERINSSKDAFEIIHPLIGDHHHEEFWILFLNRANLVIGKTRVSSGGTAGTVVDPKMIFKAALDHKASGVILCHNHPIGNLKPNNEDISLTKKIIDAGKVLEIAVPDHLIITQDDYFSFADEGMM